MSVPRFCFILLLVFCSNGWRYKENTEWGTMMFTDEWWLVFVGDNQAGVN